MIMKTSRLLIVVFAAQLCCYGSLHKQSRRLALFKPENPCIDYTGRIDLTDPRRPRLVGAGAYFQTMFKGSACTVFLEDQGLNDNHNYVSVVIDREYRGRIRVDKNVSRYEIAKDLADTKHSLMVCKATEAQNGYIEFQGLRCAEIMPFQDTRTRKIEFIGDSITCGMGLDSEEIPCGSGEWYDQHNAYFAYGPLVARQLDADWLLSSVSGIGVVRNSNSPGPTMPDVYEHTYLDVDSNSVWEADRYVPDLVSICLGTNDFADGDGIYDRGELDSHQFIATYIQFLEQIRARYPEAQICCLTSPMLSDEKSAQLTAYLTSVTGYMREVLKDEKVHLFVFAHSYVSGCFGHPDWDEHEKMAEQLLPFFKQVMDW
jgi:lysophospholipase L1-like esterase